jgi:MFS family permease
MGDALAPPPRSSFARYWTAAAISSFGSGVTAVAMPVLVVQLLGATPFEVGVVNTAQFVPYALLGLIAGVYTDRRLSRKKGEVRSGLILAASGGDLGLQDGHGHLAHPVPA